jgi:hypothetical protein
MSLLDKIRAIDESAAMEITQALLQMDVHAKALSDHVDMLADDIQKLVGILNDSE